MLGLHKKIKAAIIGASGYTGAELVRLLLAHPNVEITHLVANTNAGQAMEQSYPHLKFLNLPRLEKLEDVSWGETDVVFCCLPHATTQEVIAKLPEKLKVIDLSADFRLKDTKAYEQWYGHAHQAPQLQKEAVYGLCELFRDQVKSARIIACPGCYPTSATLPLAPLLQHQLIETDGIIIDSKSGVSGAGRSAKQGSLFCEVNDNFKAYGVCSHRHMPEIEQTLSIAAGTDIQVHFSPHLVPMNRGILSTIYVRLSPKVSTDNLRETLSKQYGKEPFVHVLAKGDLPSTRDVYGTNHCVIGVTEGRGANTAVLVSVIDNLVKGASGQAVQNMNILYGLAETTGLLHTPLFP